MLGCEGFRFIKIVKLVELLGYSASLGELRVPQSHSLADRPLMIIEAQSVTDADRDEHSLESLGSLKGRYKFLSDRNEGKWEIGNL